MIQQFKFTIPQKLEDLSHPQEDPNIFYVNDELTSLEIAQRLPESEASLKEDALNIDQEFDVFYSVLKNFNDLDSLTVDRAWTLIFKTTNAFKEQLRDIFSVLNESRGSINLENSQNTSLSQDNRGNLFESVHEKLRYANALRMLVYIDCTFVQLFEDALSSQTHRQNFNESCVEGATPAARRKRKQRLNDDARDISFKVYDTYKTRIMKNLFQLISVPLNRIADSQTEAREIVGTIMRVCYKMIENSGFNNLTRDKELLEVCFSLLGIGIEKFNQSLSFCLKFIQMLQHREQLAPLLADLVEFIVTRYEQRLLIGEILREVDRIDVKELSRDSSCPKAVSAFLISLSEKCPQEFLPSLNHLFGHLEQDSYIMRNASLNIMVNLIIKCLSQKDEDKTLRDELLDALLAHVRDITSYTRSKALSAWCTLCENQCIPITYVVAITDAAVGRLKDKSCLVRKNAVRFIISILSRNPFAARLPMQAFLDRYVKEKELLEELKRAEEEKTIREEEALETISQSSQDQSITSDTEPEAIHPTIKIKNLVLTEETPVVTQQRKVTYLEDAIAFTKHILKAIPCMLEMLLSKNITDTQEAIDFFVHCHEFGIDEALIGFKRMILLINMQEKSIKEAVSSAYKRIFFESSRYHGKSNVESLVVTNLINFVQTASIGECLSLEVLLGQFIESRDITYEMENELFARFTRRKSNTSMEEAIAAIQITGMLASTKPDVINRHLQLCIQYGLASDGCGEQESRLIRETCIAIKKSIPRKLAAEKRRTLRYAKDDPLFSRLSDILVHSLNDMSSVHWFSMCDEALHIIFDLAEHPDMICETIFTRLSEVLLKNAVESASPSPETRKESPDLVFQPVSIQATGTTTCSSQNQATTELVNPIALARYIHFLGDVALNLSVFLEIHVLAELKIRNAKSSGGDTSLENISAHNISISSRRRSRRFGGANVSMNDENLEEEVGLGGADAEDAELELVESICDDELVCGKNLLAKLSRVINEVVTDPFRYPHAELKQASSLALAKYMMVSTKYCNDHLRLLFTILEKSKDNAIKINLLIAISDLCIRFPNHLDGWTGKIFDCLQNNDVNVRRAALKILSRLVLCDILKAKDQISTMANLIVDDDEQISSYSRHFFLELSKKLNAIYNVLPDIISRLSDSKMGLDEERFRIVMKFMFELIDKSQHIDRLVDKLCGRFMDTDDERHWADLAYCLSLLKYSDKSMSKLYDKFDCYKDKLCIESVKESITTTISNYRKTAHLKNEMKQLLDEFEAKIAKTAGEEAEQGDNKRENNTSGTQVDEEGNKIDDNDDQDTIMDDEAPSEIATEA